MATKVRVRSRPDRRVWSSASEPRLAVLHLNRAAGALVGNKERPLLSSPTCGLLANFQSHHCDYRTASRSWFPAVALYTPLLLYPVLFFSSLQHLEAMLPRATLSRDGWCSQAAGFTTAPPRDQLVRSRRPRKAREFRIRDAEKPLSRRGSKGIKQRRRNDSRGWFLTVERVA